MHRFIQYMRVLKLSEVTISDRVELIRRLQTHLPVDLLEATTEHLMAFQSTYAHLAPASVHIYTRHIRAFYRYARKAGLIAVDPAQDIDLPRLVRARPHPTQPRDLKLIFACAQGRLRRAYILAVFAGLRRGEICRLHSRDIDYEGHPTALIHGKGGKERVVPLLPPVVEELGYMQGWAITTVQGRQMQPGQLSADSTKFLQSIGVASTLHSMRATFATQAVRMTHDHLMVRDILGHASVATTEIYIEPDHANAHERLAGFSDIADRLMAPRRLAVVRA